MIRFTLRTLFKNKVLWAWPALFLFFTWLIFAWGDISAGQNSYSFMVHLGELQLPSGIVVKQLISLVVLICIIGLPSHFAQNLKPARASLLLSKPISRTEFFFSDFTAMLGVSVIYSLASISFLIGLVAIQTGTFPFQFHLSLLLFLPFLLLTYYITITLFLILTNSYLGGVIVGYLVASFSSVFLNIDQFLEMIGWSGTFIESLFYFFSYLIPSAGAVESLLLSILNGGFSAFDGELFLFALVSCLPFAALSYYLFLNKEF